MGCTTPDWAYRPRHLGLKDQIPAQESGHIVQKQCESGGSLQARFLHVSIIGVLRSPRFGPFQGLSAGKIDRFALSKKCENEFESQDFLP